MAYILSKVSILRLPVLRKNIISGPINKNTLVRNYEHLTNKTNAWAEQKFKLKDNISDSYRLVYREQAIINAVTTTTFNLGWLGLFTSTFLLGYLIYKNPPVREETPKDVSTTGHEFRPLTAVERILMLLASFVVSTVLVVVSRSIPFRIYYNSAEKVFKAVFVSRILGRRPIETFGEGTAVPVFSRKFLGGVLFNINGRIVILDKECFPVQAIRDQMIRKSPTAE